MYYILIMILGIGLVALATVSLVKNFLINFNVSDNGWKTISVAVLIALCLLFAAIAYSEAFTVREIKDRLSVSGSVTEKSVELQRMIPIKTATASVTIVLGCASYLLHLRQIKKIQDYKQQLIAKNASNRWAGRV